MGGIDEVIMPNVNHVPNYLFPHRNTIYTQSFSHKALSATDSDGGESLLLTLLERVEYPTQTTVYHRSEGGATQARIQDQYPETREQSALFPHPPPFLFDQS